MKNQKHLTSSIRPGDLCTAPLRILLHESHSSTPTRPEWVTHQQNMQDGGMFSGHYFRAGDGVVNPAYAEMSPIEAYAAALTDYVARCVLLCVDPIPSEAVQAIPAGIPRGVTRAKADQFAQDVIAARGDHTCDRCGQVYELPSFPQPEIDGLCPECAAKKIASIDAGERATLPGYDC